MIMLDDGEFGTAKTVAYRYKLEHLTKLSIFGWISVVFCYVTSSICSALFLTVLMVCALVHTFYNNRDDRSSSTSSTMLTKEERRLRFDLQFYMRLSDLDVDLHTVTTQDGFNLVLHHVVNRNETEEERSQRYPVLMLHGLMQSSAAYATSGDNSLAMHLFRMGFDVWLGNNRCGFDSTHIQYSRFNIHMWQWGIGEMGSIDVPCMMDYVLNHSRSDKVALVAHSQGTTQTFYTLARDFHPEIGNKISSFVALSPAVYTGPLLDRWFLKFIRYLPRPLYHVFFGHHSFIGLMNVFHGLMPKRLYTYFGYIMFNYMLGWNDTLWDRNYRARQFLFSPVHVSSELMHWWLGKDGFASQGCIFDESMDHWFDEHFPPLALFVPGRDNLVNPYALINRLQSYERFREFRVYDLPTYSHLDVLWASDVIDRVGRPMADFIWAQIEDQDNWRFNQIS